MATTGVQHSAAEMQPARSPWAAESSSTTSNSSGTGSSSSSSSGSATISANDFLTLLVTEMQNQDPTANTDPNEYINQLVQVNSLEQLININQTLGDAFPSKSSSQAGTGKAKTDAADATGDPVSGGAPTNDVVAAQPTAGTGTFAAIDGNLSAPQTSGAAERVAHALDGRSSLAKSAPGSSLLH